MRASRLFFLFEIDSAISHVVKNISEDYPRRSDSSFCFDTHAHAGYECGEILWAKWTNGVSHPSYGPLTWASAYIQLTGLNAD